MYPRITTLERFGWTMEWIMTISSFPIRWFYRLVRQCILNLSSKNLTIHGELTVRWRDIVSDPVLVSQSWSEIGEYSWVFSLFVEPNRW
jgi:hypothetical protein